MDHADHVALLRRGVRSPADGGAVWADFGAGTGAFTLALADLLGAGARVVAVDLDPAALAEAAAAVAGRFPGVGIETRLADFRTAVALPQLDGLVMANSLHFVPRREQVEVVRRLAAHLRPGGRFLVVEYDAERGNPWVPYPFPPVAWQRMAGEAGLVNAAEIGRVPGRWLGAIWSGMAARPLRS